MSALKKGRSEARPRADVRTRGRARELFSVESYNDNHNNLQLQSYLRGVHNSDSLKLPTVESRSEASLDAKRRLPRPHLGVLSRQKWANPVFTHTSQSFRQ
jgi:hypothetical protein